MTISEFCRWMCLIEAFTIIENKAEELGVSSKDLLDASAIDEYINGSNGVRKTFGRYHSMLHNIECEMELGLL